MPIDPRIVFGLDPAARPPDPIAQFAQLQGARNLINQGPVQQQEQQLRDLQIKEHERKAQQADLDTREDQVLQQLWGEHQGNPTAILKAAAGKVRAKTYAGIQKTFADASKAVAEIAQSELPVMQDQNSRLTALTQQVLAIPDDQYAQQWPTIRATALQINPKLQLPDQPIPKDQLAIKRLQFMTEGNFLSEEAEKRARAAELRASALHAPALAEAQEKATGAALKNAGQEPIQPVEQARIDESKLTPDYKNFQLSQKEGFKGSFEQWQTTDANRRRTINQFTIPGLGAGQNQQLTGEAYLKTLPPGTAAQIKAIAEGRVAAPTAANRSQAAQQLRAALFQYDPTFSEQRAQVRKAFTTGKEGQNIGALNTAIVHLGRLGETAEALKNGSFTPGNEVFNWAKDKFGSETVTNFELLKDAVAGEMAAALKGNATDIEIANMKKSIRASNSPAQMQGVVGEGMGILADKANTYTERYHREMPDDTTWSPVLPSAKAQLTKHGVKKTEGGASLPAEAKSKLKAGHETTFGNGQVWTLDPSGKEKRVR